jgi:hypothetical protein
VFSSSLYRGRGPPKTDMNDGNESGKDGGLVCTGIVPGGVKGSPAFTRLLHSKALAACANGLKGQWEKARAKPGRGKKGTRGSRGSYQVCKVVRCKV